MGFFFSLINLVRVNLELLIYLWFQLINIILKIFNQKYVIIYLAIITIISLFLASQEEGEKHLSRQNLFKIQNSVYEFSEDEPSSPNNSENFNRSDSGTFKIEGEKDFDSRLETNSIKERKTVHLNEYEKE